MSAIFLRSIIQAIAIVLVLVTTILLAFFVGPKMESKFFPVVTNAKVIIVPNEPSDPPGIRVLLFSTKKREGCELVNRLVSVRVGNDTWVRATAFFKDEGTQQWAPLGNTRPIGDLIVDQVQVRPKGEGLHIVLLHRCHPFWLTATTEVELETLESKDGPIAPPPIVPGPR